VAVAVLSLAELLLLLLVVVVILVAAVAPAFPLVHLQLLVSDKNPCHFLLLLVDKLAAPLARILLLVLQLRVVLLSLLLLTASADVPLPPAPS
jgi:hypothetical protein